jgi:hypothetical protein
LWGQCGSSTPAQRLGRTYEAFRQRWFQKSFDGYGVDPLPYAQTEIQDKLRDICLTIDAKDWFDLERADREQHLCRSAGEGARKYREMERRCSPSSRGRTVEAFGAAARTQKCLQLANGAVYVIRTPTATRTRARRNGARCTTRSCEALESIVEEANGMPLLVSYEFKSDSRASAQSVPEGARARRQTRRPRRIGTMGKSRCSWLTRRAQATGSTCRTAATSSFSSVTIGILELYMQIIERIGPCVRCKAGTSGRCLSTTSSRATPSTSL